MRIREEDWAVRLSTMTTSLRILIPFTSISNLMPHSIKTQHIPRTTVIPTSDPSLLTFPPVLAISTLSQYQNRPRSSVLLRQRRGSSSRLRRAMEGVDRDSSLEGSVRRAQLLDRLVILPPRMDLGMEARHNFSRHPLRSQVATHPSIFLLLPRR